MECLFISQELPLSGNDAVIRNTFLNKNQFWRVGLFQVLLNAKLCFALTGTLHKFPGGQSRKRGAELNVLMDTIASNKCKACVTGILAYNPLTDKPKNIEKPDLNGQLKIYALFGKQMVGVTGIEPVTPTMSM